MNLYIIILWKFNILTSYSFSKFFNPLIDNRLFYNNPINYISELTNYIKFIFYHLLACKFIYFITNFLINVIN